MVITFLRRTSILPCLFHRTNESGIPDDASLGPGVETGSVGAKRSAREKPRPREDQGNPVLSEGDSAAPVALALFVSPDFHCQHSFLLPIWDLLGDDDIPARCIQLMSFH